jgi:DNA-binding LacI/PurR family transcriptional regulator
MADVARLAGTSKSTVSRVLSGRGTISPTVRERVLRVVDETGFVPDAFGRRLAQSRATHSSFKHHALAVAFCVSKEGFSRFWDETYTGVMACAQDRRLAVLSVLLREEELARNAMPEPLARMQFDGLLLLTTPATVPSVSRRFGPCVLFGPTTPAGITLPSVEPDNETGVAALAAHLAELGHRRIEFVPGDARHLAFERRWEALRRAAQERGLSVTRAEPVNGLFHDYINTFQGAPREERPTALVVSNDQTAIELMHVLLERGISAPRDVSVVGFDGDPAGASSVPHLTTWQVDWRGLGRMAVNQLVEMIEGRPVASRTLVGGSLVERQSTARPRVAAEAVAAAY